MFRKKESLFFHFVVYSCCALLFVSVSVQAASIDSLRSARPRVKLSEVSDSAYQHASIRVKLDEKTIRRMPQGIMRASSAGPVRTGIPSLDSLNKRVQAQEFRKTFEPLFSDPDLRSASLRSRHEAWGFHRWYDVSFDSTRSVKEVVALYNNNKNVTKAEPIYRIRKYADSAVSWEPDDPRFNEQWHYHNTGQYFGTAGRDISLKNAWAMERGHSDVLVAVVDEGIDYNHPDLQGNMWDEIGKNFVDSTLDTIVPGNHGTHVAGTVAGMNNNGIGIAGVAGGDETQAGVTLMSCQILGGAESEYGGSHLALIYAADRGAAIAQNSWGYDAPDVWNEADLDAIDYFNAHGGGTVMDSGITIFAAGNNGENADYYPGAYENALSVAATDNSDERASYSNYSASVDISAPGGGMGNGGVLSTVTRAAGNYGFMQGTSMACPHVSGAAALLISAAHRNGVTLTAGQVRELLLQTADSIDDINSEFAGMLGTGRLNAYAALKALENEYLPELLAPADIAAVAQNHEEIRISWKKNSAGHDVILLRSEDTEFGIPEPGTEYTAGDTLDGGGTVLYRGDDTLYSDTGRSEGTRYFYQAFSVDTAQIYSLAWKNSSATTWHFTAEGTAEDPRIIDSPEKLKALSSFSRYWDAHYRQTTDIDAGVSTDWNNGSGFIPVGTEETPFRGFYHGGGHRVSNLRIYSGKDFSGFFGFIQGGSVDSLGIVDIDITGGSQSGAMVGSLRGGEIQASFTTGNVQAGMLVGGFAGGAHDASRIENCYTRCAVSGSQYIGGFIGSSQAVTLKNVYSTNRAEGEFGGGGFAGTTRGSTIEGDAFWDMEASGLTTSDLGTGKTTEEMTNPITFSGWQDDLWELLADKNDGYPRLKWEKNTTDIIQIDTAGSSDGVGIIPQKNPVSVAEGSFVFTLKAQPAVRVQIFIYDVLGNILDEQDAGIAPGTSHVFAWDMTNRRGQAVSPGTYLVVARTRDSQGRTRQYRKKIGVSR
ncbi:MAG: S8 family serine peptidase [Fibrobacterota bacterium]